MVRGQCPKLKIFDYRSKEVIDINLSLNELCTIVQLARYLKISRGRVHQLITQKKLLAYRVGEEAEKSSVYIDRDSVRDLLERRRKRKELLKKRAKMKQDVMEQQQEVKSEEFQVSSQI